MDLANIDDLKYNTKMRKNENYRIFEPEPGMYLLIREDGHAISYTPADRMIMGGHTKKVKLTPDTNHLFHRLVFEPKKLHSYIQLYQDQWQFAPIDPRSIKWVEEVRSLFRPQISRLRKTLELAHPDLPRGVATIRGDGYAYDPHHTVAREIRWK